MRQRVLKSKRRGSDHPGGRAHTTTLVRNTRRFSSLSLFALASGFVVLALGTAVAVYLGDRIQGQALEDARANAAYIARLGFAPRLGTLRHRVHLSPPEKRGRDRLMHMEASSALVGVQVVNRKARLVWESNPGRLGGRLVAGSAIRQALTGRIAASVTSLAAPGAGGSGQRVLAVAVPAMRSEHRGAPGAVLVLLDYGPIATRIEHTTREVDLALLLGLALIYAVLSLNSASSKLRGQAEKLRRHADETEYLAHHDGLTGLPNRILLRDRAHQAILYQARRGGRIAIMVMDIDGFKEVNDGLGHNGGDQLLRDVADRIRSTLRDSDTAARLGGDEFAVLLPEVADADASVHVATRIRRALQQPFQIQAVTVSVDTSIGIVLYPDHGADYEELLQRADVAMYAAKQTRTGHRLHTSEVEDSYRARLGLASDLHDAIARGTLDLYYQPQASLRTGAIVAVEALARWTHPQHGSIPPDVFIPLAERSGAIRALTLRVIRDALTQAAILRKAGIDLHTSVNLSTRDLLDMQLSGEIERALLDSGMPASRLEVEITESVIMADPERARAVLAQLRSMGIRVTIDDFGTGYSSLGYLKRLAVDQLKIDKAFVLNMIQDATAAVIVRSTIELAHNLGLTVVAEGVEDAAVWTRLAELGCDTAQGYHLCPPIPRGRLTTWLETYSRPEPLRRT